MFRFLASEQTLSQQLGTEIRSPIRLFDLDGCRVDGTGFISAILPSFAQLEYDHYTVRREQMEFLLRVFPGKQECITSFFAQYPQGINDTSLMNSAIGELSQDERHHFQRIKPYRRRSLAQFELVFHEHAQKWVVSRIPAHSFTQQTNDYRSQPRTFAEMSERVTEHSAFKTLLLSFAQLVKSLHQDVQRLQCVCHQVSLTVFADGSADNAPEGIHQDGADYIVSALVIERRNVQGGTSVIYGGDKQTQYLTTTLQPGQGVFHGDKGSDLWHDVTPIVLDPQSFAYEGVRNILGFDIHIGSL